MAIEGMTLIGDQAQSRFSSDDYERGDEVEDDDKIDLEVVSYA